VPGPNHYEFKFQQCFQGNREQEDFASERNRKIHGASLQRENQFRKHVAAQTRSHKGDRQGKYAFQRIPKQIHPAGHAPVRGYEERYLLGDRKEAKQFLLPEFFYKNEKAWYFPPKLDYIDKFHYAHWNMFHHPKICTEPTNGLEIYFH
jgi:hypothetical protein